MTRIGPTEQILVLLRARLERRARTVRDPSSEILDAQTRLQAMAGVRDLPDRSFRQALVRGLLADRMGEALAGDPAFDQVVREVLDLMEGNPETAALLEQAGAALRGG